MQASQVSIMLHKPLHYASCRAPVGTPLARSLLVPGNRAAICRTRHDPRQLSKLAASDILDEASTGLLVFSQDGRGATRISRSLDFKKEYRVQLVGEATESQLIALRASLSTSQDGDDIGSPCARVVVHDPL